MISALQAYSGFLRLTLSTTLLLCTPCVAGGLDNTGNGEITRNLHGTTKANALVDMRMPVSGTVTSAQRRMGERVQAGDVLLQIDNREAHENRLLRQAELQRSEAENSLAYKQWQRMLTSHEKGVIADLDVDRAYLEYQQRLAERKIAEARLHMAVIHLDKHRLVALTGGIIIDDGPPQGEFLSAGEPALGLLDDSNQTIIVQLSENEIDQLQKNELSLHRRDQSGPTLGIARVAPQTLQNSTLIQVEVVSTHSLSGNTFVGALIPLHLRTTSAQDFRHSSSMGSVANRGKGSGSAN